MLWMDDQPEAFRPAHQANPPQQIPQQDGAGHGTPDNVSASRPSSLRISPANDQRTRSGTAAMRAQARTSQSVVRMSDTIRPRHWRSHRQTVSSPKLLAYARALGVSESVAERRVYGPESVNLQAAKLIAAMILRGETDDAAVFEAPISAAMLGPVLEPLPELQRSADESDGYEDVCQSAWVHEHTDESLALYIRKLASDLYHGSRLLAALKAEQAKRAEK